MSLTPALLPALIAAASTAIDAHEQEVTELDLAIGDGDHVTNLKRGLQALTELSDELAVLEWAAAWQKMGMTVLSTVGGASGSLLGTFFLWLSKAAKDQPITPVSFATSFNQAVTAVKQRGKSDAGEKTMLDVLIPVAAALQQCAENDTPVTQTLETIKHIAFIGMESTRDMLATKGRASFLDERSRGHIDAGARTTQLMIEAVANEILKALN